jgi:virulence factor Mce-like protein
MRAGSSPQRSRRRRLTEAEIAGRALRWGALSLLVIALVTYFGFSKHIPFTHGFRVHAVFSSANSIRKNSPVRIAGVNVGKVTSIERHPGGTAALVTMEVGSQGLPLHRDATLKIRPRIFLEGNFFVDLSPGTAASPVLREGDTLPLTQTAEPVQFDQILTALQFDTRTQLQSTLAAFGRALTLRPGSAQDATQDPAVAGRTAAQALNQSLRYSGSAFRDAAIVSQGLLGSQPHDVSRLIGALGKVTAALDRNESQLQGLVTNFDTTMAAFASQAGNLRRSVAQLGPTVANAHSALTDLNRALPPTRTFAREILPGVRETSATINAGFPWIAATRGLLGPAELRGVAAQLQPAVGDLARVIDASLALLPQLDLAGRCLSNVVLPAGNVRIQDGPLSTGVENYKEFWYSMVGLAGEGQNFDANGMYVRFQAGGGDHTVSTGGADQQFGNAAAKPLGTRPAFPGHKPPYRSDVPCYTQKVPDINSAPTGAPDASIRTVVDGGHG